MSTYLFLTSQLSSEWFSALGTEAHEGAVFMKKNVVPISLIISMLAVVLCGVLAPPVVAGAEEADSPKPREMVSAYLENEDGERIEVTG